MRDESGTSRRKPGLGIGLALVEQLAELHGAQHTREMPVIAVCGRRRDADRQKAIESGFDAHIGKPLGLDKLRVAVDEASAAHRRADAPGSATTPAGR